MPARRCDAEGCSNYSDTSNPENKRLFKFPKDLDCCKEWVRKAGNRYLLQIKSEKLNVSTRLCSDHFDDNQYFNNKKNTLMRGAIPRLFKYPPLSEEEMAVWPVTDYQVFEVEEHNEIPTEAHNETPPVEEPIPSTPVPSTHVFEPPLEPLHTSPPRPQASCKPTLENPPKKTRVTVNSLARAAGLKPMELSPKKTSILKLAQVNYQKSCVVRRRLQYSVDTATRFLTMKREMQNKRTVTEMEISAGARNILAGELRNFNRKPGAREWTINEKCFYLSLYKRSPKSYRFMKENMTMPSEKTLKDVLECVKLEPGLSPFLMSALEKKVDKLEEKDRACVLMFDEVYINCGLYYNPKTDQIEGYEDLGHRGRTNREANHALVFMARGLDSDWKMPLGFYFIDGTCPSDALALIIPQVVQELQKINIPTIASVSDQGPTNRGAISILRSKCSQGEHDSVYQVDDQLVVHLWDTPHVLKSLRNNFLTSDLEFEPGRIASWTNLIEYFKLDEGLCKTSKLNYVHLCPVGRNRMRVGLASQAFSETNASGMDTFYQLTQGRMLANSKPTIDCIRFVDKLFDSANGPGNKNNDIKKYRMNVTENSFHHSFWREAREKIERWVYIRRTDNKQHKPPCLQGWLDNLRGFGRIWCRAKALGIKSLKLRNLNQDPLENYFGQIRQTCGSSSDPTVPQFIAGMKTCLIQQISSTVRGSNCEKDDGNFLADMVDLIKEANESRPEDPHPTLVRGNTPANIENNPLSKLTRQAPSLTCATICTKILSAHQRCPECVHDLVASENSSDFTLQEMRHSSSSLDKPSPQLTNFYIVSEKLVTGKWKEIGWQKQLRSKIIDLLAKEDLLEWLTCAAHKDAVKDSLLNLIGSRIINLFCTKFNQERKCEKLRVTRQVLQRKSGQVPKDYGLEDLQQADLDRLTGLQGIKRKVVLQLQNRPPTISSPEHLQAAIEQTREENSTSDHTEFIDQSSAVASGTWDHTEAREPPPKRRKLLQMTADNEIMQNTDQAGTSVGGPPNDIVLQSCDEFSLLDAFEAAVSSPGTSQTVPKMQQLPPGQSVVAEVAKAKPAMRLVRTLSVASVASVNGDDIEGYVQTWKSGKAADLNIKQLKALAKHYGVAGYSRFNKGPLIEHIRKSNKIT